MSDPQNPPPHPERPGQRVVSLDGAQTGDVSIGDVAGRDIHKNTIINQAKLSYEELQSQRNRAALLSLVRRFWVEGVLHESLHQRVRIELGMQARPDTVDHPWRNIVRLPGQAPQTLAPGQSIRTVFEQAGSRLLILGAPGGGKTTTLLTLAEQLLDAAQADSFLPIPVVFQLSTWAVARPALADWLVTELKERYKVPPKVGTAWIATGEILPLLDGLDEVGPTDAERAACIQAINAYLGETGAQAVVCSRTAEYARLSARLSLESAIEVQPLDTAQIDGYLSGFAASLSGLRAAVAKDATLSDLAASPLLLSVMALAYRDTLADDLVGQERKAAYARLWNDYVQNRFALERADAPTDPHQLRAWLIWLARGMITHGQQVFYIEYLQPSWLESRRQRRLFRILSLLCYCLVSSLVCGLLSGLVGGLVNSLVSGVTLGLAIGLAFGLLFGLGFSSGNIELAETLSWAWGPGISGQRIGRKPVGGVVSGLLGGLGGLLIGSTSGIAFGPVGGLIGSFIGGLFFGLAFSGVYGRFYNLFSGLFMSVLFGVIWGRFYSPMSGLAFSLTISLFFGLFGGFVRDEILISTQPNEGVRRSQWSMSVGGVFYCMIGGLVGILTIGQIGDQGEGIAFGAFVGLAGGMITGLLNYGGAAVLKHYILRLLLRFRCGAPWGFAAALDEAVSRTLMTRVGGGYRFYHRLLQEHFAEHEHSDLPIAPILGPQPGDTAAGRRAQG
ncbi:NACHT domain-containing protein [Chloroflexales bacterium ZM16-3]|nr:NACHT domain-containing protein [Chloroflexales bacterium ZM16-3]